MDKYCINCGAELKAGDAFCYKCGKQVKSYGLGEQKDGKRRKMGLTIAVSVLAAVVAVVAIIVAIGDPDNNDNQLYTSSANNSKTTNLPTSGGGSAGGKSTDQAEGSTIANANITGFSISNLYGTWEYIGYYVDTGYEKGELPTGELIQSDYYRYELIEDGAKIVFNDNGQMYHIPGNSVWGYDYYNVVEWFGYYDIYYEGYCGSTETYNMISEDTILLKRSAEEHEDIPPKVELYKKVSDDMDPTVINGNSPTEANIFSLWYADKYYPAEYDGIEGYANEIDYNDTFCHMRFLSKTQVLIGDSMYFSGAFDDPVWPKEFTGQGDGIHASIQIVHPDELRVCLSLENEGDIVLYYHGEYS